MLDSAFINETYAKVNALKQAPESWYENPTFAYIPVIGTVVSAYAQFCLSTKLEELKKTLGDIRSTPTAFYIHRRAREHVREWDLLAIPGKETIYENWNREIADLQQKVDAMQREIPRIIAKGSELLEVSYHQACVSIIQGVLLYAIAISNIALGILNPAIGVPLLLIGGLIIAGNGALLVNNLFEARDNFKTYTPRLI